MEIEFLSPTKLETGRLCRARLKAKYAGDGEYEEEQGDPAKQGTLVHEAAKLWYRRQDLKGRPINTVDEAFKVAIEQCHAMKDFNGKPNSQVPNSPQALAEARTLFEVIAAFYPRDKINVIFAERKYKGALSNGVKVNLIVDLMVDRGNGVCEIIDYKTGFIMLADDEMEDKDQVLMNLLAVTGDPALAAFPHKQFRYFWVRSGHQSAPVSLTVERLADYQMWLALEWQSILDDNDPKETINRFCKSCPRRNNPKDLCKKYSEYLAEAYGLTNIQEVTPIKAEDAVQLGDDEVMARYDRLGSQIKMLEANLAVFKDYLKARIQLAGAKEMQGEKFKAALVSAKRTVLSTDIVLAMCQQYNIPPTNLLTPGNEKVLSAFSPYPEAVNHLQLNASKVPNQPWVKVSPLSPQKKATRKKKKDADAAAKTETTSTTPETADVQL